MEDSMKKLFCIAIAALFALSLTACESSGEPEYYSPAAPQRQSAAPAPSATPASAPLDQPELTPGAPISTAIDEAMVPKLTPEGATVLTNTAGSLVLESKLDITALKEFYKAALQELGIAEQNSLDEETGWQYVGNYGDGKELNITIILMGNANNIMITY